MVRVKCHRAEKGLALGVAGDLVQGLLLLQGAAGVSAATDTVLAGLHPARGSVGHKPARQEPTAYAYAILDLIRAVAFEGPLAILVDDLQWVDTESRALLARVARKLGDEGVLLLFTTRDPLSVADLLDARGELVELGPLSMLEVAELVQLAVEIDPPEESESVSARIAEASSGNPLFVGEILKRLADDGVVMELESSWRLDAGRLPADIPLPDSVQDLIGERIARLPEDQLAVCNILAARPGAQDPSAVRAAAGLEDATFLRVLSDLVARGVLEWVGPSRVDFAHEHLREAFGAAERPTSPLRVSKSRWAAAAVVVILTVAGVSRLALSAAAPEPSYPYGKGVVTMFLDGEPVGLRPPNEMGGGFSWEPVLRPVSATQGRRTTTGEVVWVGTQHDPVLGPAAVEIDAASGRVRIIRDTPGDDSAWGISPDGESFLVATENLQADAYANRVEIVDRRTLVVRTLFDRGTWLGGGGDWSPDGLKFPVSPQRTGREMLFLDPSGREVQRLQFPDSTLLHSAKWCEDSRHLVAIPQHLSGFRRPYLVDLATESWLSLDDSAYPFYSAIECIGDGAAVLMLGVVENRQALVLVDLLRDTTIVLDSAVAIDGSLVWIPDTAPPVSQRLTITPTSTTLDGGTQVSMAASLWTTAGMRPARPQWTSSAPRVVSIDSGGSATAIRPGEAWLLATVGGWLTDSILVRVPTAPNSILLADAFETFDALRWRSYGEPTPRIISSDGHRVLSHEGDGRYADPIVSVGSFDLTEGGSVEVEFLLLLNRDDRQRIVLCLDSGSGTWAGARILEEVSLLEPQPGGQEICVTYPRGELDTRRRDEMTLVLGALSAETAVPVAPSMGSGAWTSLALQLGPDGTIEIFVDHVLVHTSRWKALFDADARWRVVIAGAAVDTQLLLRNLTVTRGARF